MDLLSEIPQFEHIWCFDIHISSLRTYNIESAVGGPTQWATKKKGYTYNEKATKKNNYLFFFIVFNLFLIFFNIFSYNFQHPNHWTLKFSNRNETKNVVSSYYKWWTWHLCWLVKCRHDGWLAYPLSCNIAILSHLGTIISLHIVWFQKVMEIEDDMGGPDPSLSLSNETTTVSTAELPGILCSK